MFSRFYGIYFWVVWRVVVVVVAGNVNSSSSIFSKQHCQRQVVAINSHNHSTLHYIEIWTTGPRAKIFCSSHYINTCKNSWVDRGAARYILHSPEIWGFRSIKCFDESLQNLIYFVYKKTHIVFFSFFCSRNEIENQKNFQMFS